VRLVAVAAPLAVPGCSRVPVPDTAVRPGIEVLATDSIHLLHELRVGLITNHTGTTRDGVPSAVVLLEAGVDVVALFGPEHGLHGTAGPGEAVEDARDQVTDLPVYSLYGRRLSPDTSMLRGLDALVFDIQDIGARYYTYVTTMAEAMKVAARAGLTFIVADRPNPIGGVRVQGNVLDPSFASFVGRFPIPMRHGMTAGELALMFNSEYGIGADLHVVPVDGWLREAWADETGLPWIAPSPNMPTLESAAHYPGTCLFEGTSMSVGRGTDRPFQQIGAPWLDASELTRRMEARSQPGVRFEVVRFTPVEPDDGKYEGQTAEGIRLTVTDRNAYDPTATAVALIIEARDLSGDRWAWQEETFDRLAGTGSLRQAIESGVAANDIAASWAQSLRDFRRARSRFLLYP